MELKYFIGSKIKELRESRGMNQDQLADLLNTTKQAVSRYERGDRQANQDILFELSKIFKVGVDEFFPQDEADAFIVAESATDYRYIPQPISAGLPTSVEGSQQLPTLSIPDSVMGKYAGQRNIRMMRVNGDSMNKVIPDGSLIAVKKMPLDNIKDGDIVVYCDNYEYAVKRMYRTDGKLIFRPDSHNPTFTDYITDADEQLDIVGKVVIYIVELD